MTHRIMLTLTCQ